MNVISLLHSNMSKKKLFYLCKMIYSPKSLKWHYMSEDKNDNNITVDIEEYDEKVNDDKLNDDKVNDDKVNEDNFWLTTKYKVTVTDGGKQNSYIIADTSAYNIVINHIENDINHNANTLLDKKYTITECGNIENKKTSKQQTFMFHYNNPALDKKTKGWLWLDLNFIIGIREYYYSIKLNYWI